LEALLRPSYEAKIQWQAGEEDCGKALVVAVQERKSQTKGDTGGGFDQI